MPRVAMITASLGGFDQDMQHVEQTLPHERFAFTDENFPPRSNSMKPRLQAKIPKLFGWQMVPGYDYYFWLDGNLTLNHPDTLKYFFDNIPGYDVVAFQHPRRRSAEWELRYLMRGMRNSSRYLHVRYANEWIEEQLKALKDDPDFVDDILVNGGAFMYRDTPAVRQMFKEWWHHVSRYLVMDQASFAYALKKSGVRLKILPDDIYRTPYLKQLAHNYRA